MSDFDASKLELLLRFKGWTYKELAARAGISVKHLSNIRKRITEFKEEEVEEICCAAGFPKSFFLIPEEELPVDRLTFRRPSRMLVKDIDHVSGEFTMLYDSAMRLLSMCSLEGRSQWLDGIAPDSDPTANDIERLAVEARICLGLPDSGPVPNAMWAFESGGIVVAPITSISKENEDSVEGVSYPSESGGPVIAYSRRRRSGDGIRFTVSHEAGHLILQKKRTPSTKKMKESEAHRFAGAFLITEKDARAVLSPGMGLHDLIRVKAEWGVSISALIMRATHLGIIDRDRQRSLMMQMSARHWTKKEPIQVHEEHPVFFKQMLGTNFGNIISPTRVEVSKDAVTNFLGRPFELIDTWADGISIKRETTLEDLL